MENVLLFGASSFGKIAYECIKFEKNIVGFIDNDQKKWGAELQGVKIYSPEYIFETNYEVIITSTYYEEISEQLEQANYFNYSVFRMYYERNTLGNSKVIPNRLKNISLGHLIGDKDSMQIEDITFLNGGSLVTDYFLLKALMKKFNLENYLEIGTWTGESIMTVYPIAKKCFSISLPDNDQILVNGFNQLCNKSNFSRYFSKDKSKIVSFYENSLYFDYSKIQEKIDLIFIDGDHSFDAIYKDTINVFNHVGYDDTIVVWHDFRDGSNQLITSSYNAVRKALPERYHDNLFSVDTSISGVYLPEKYKKKVVLDEDRDELFSYRVTLEAKSNHLK